MIYLEYMSSAVRVNLSYLNLCKNAHTLFAFYVVIATTVVLRGTASSGVPQRSGAAAKKMVPKPGGRKTIAWGREPWVRISKFARPGTGRKKRRSAHRRTRLAVMNRREEVLQAVEDYRSGAMGNALTELVVALRG